MTAEIKAAIERATQVLKDCGAKEVYVFGSACSGRFGPASDVDLAVSGLPLPALTLAPTNVKLLTKL